MLCIKLEAAALCYDGRQRFKLNRLLTSNITKTRGYLDLLSILLRAKFHPCLQSLTGCLLLRPLHPIANPYKD
jgi:hypothetical protein